MDDLDLPVTRKIAEDLSGLAKEIREGKQARIESDIANRIKAESEKLDASLDAELQLKTAYTLTKKRYPLESLIKSPSELLGEGVHWSLTDTAKKDFRFACMQVALSQPTAAAFHLMRTLEEQVKSLYYAFKKTKRLNKPMWGPMVKELREKRAPRPSEKLLSHLDGMRVHFRNPTQHPEMFYTLDEAQDLLNQTITAINMIASEIPKTPVPAV